MKHRQCTVVANGLFPQSERARQYLDCGRTVICCDGAARNLALMGMEPHCIVGDCDSIDPETRRRFADRIVRIAEQESNDLTKCMRHAQALGFDDVVILGATGLREDHTLGNVSLLASYCRMFGRVAMISDFGEFHAISRTTTFETVAGQQISLFALPPVAALTSHGLLYPLRRRRLMSWWEGTLNEATGNSVTIEVEGGGDVLVYLLHAGSRH